MPASTESQDVGVALCTRVHSPTSLSDSILASSWTELSMVEPPFGFCPCSQEEESVS